MFQFAHEVGLLCPCSLGDLEQVTNSRLQVPSFIEQGDDSPEITGFS